jgi:cell division protein ZapE
MQEGPTLPADGACARAFAGHRAARRRSAPEGLYLYGGVGRGKTMLLDLFFETVHYAPKRRVHFQEFMAEAHEAIERARKAAADPIASAAAEIGADAALLRFDEREVTDIADAPTNRGLT